MPALLKAPRLCVLDRMQRAGGRRPRHARRPRADLWRRAVGRPTGQLRRHQARRAGGECRLLDAARPAEVAAAGRCAADGLSQVPHRVRFPAIDSGGGTPCSCHGGADPPGPTAGPHTHTGSRSSTPPPASASSSTSPATARSPSATARPAAGCWRRNSAASTCWTCWS